MKQLELSFARTAPEPEEIEKVEKTQSEEKSDSKEVSEETAEPEIKTTKVTQKKPAKKRMNKSEKLRNASMNTKNINVWLKEKAGEDVGLETNSAGCRLGEVLAKENIHRGPIKNDFSITI